ncbi:MULTISPECIES: hypothetical protein [Mycolicibacterium]|uniref:Uncharacterized protein n=1 Tax=Mycobacterium phage Bipper TaxID=1805457 RepID=A0A142F2J7_9CAUD|nr:MULTISPECIES: hypothetical protein [Mycolicibacterium]YP_009303216.1 hypothetical protein KCH39_gp108 [Mycobacterium phage Bipper]QDF19354.1 hypothetical protein SEA_CRACKLEWINK_68 [Mycobacterium phage Cracklewink]AMQ67004.1 hypothetical protein SEA_BIPPER_69 [Mycobacterium phage Bipper]MCC9181155.1 hypothetical protein [Mycolicibacterium mageritense]UBV14856.1 hypothetical protein H8Z57_29900 [Mycolicibacterium fortuitum]
MSYHVLVVQSVSEVVEVPDGEAQTVEQAIDYAVGMADVPNISNEFDADGDPRAIKVTADDGTILWEDK